jgi:hypothetical protein
MNLTKFLKERKKVSHPAKINLRNSLAVIQSWFRKKRRNIGGLDLPDHIYEQIIWRRVRVMERSPLCWMRGTCRVCGCDILGKTMEDRACSISEHPDLLERREPCYPEMMSKEKWNEYKISNNIKLFE